MQRYSIFSPLVAVRLCPSGDTGKVGVLTSLPSDAVVEACGPSELGTGMIEVSWDRQRFAVFERDLETRANLEPSESLAVVNFSAEGSGE
ncbi:MAG TPA: hypothetical protein VGV35_07210 [Bryobacteraceae bacterium]|nr:hypothetical protein [Bryobacteraceae bacterium]